MALAVSGSSGLVPASPVKELGQRMTSREGSVFISQLVWQHNQESRWDPRGRRGRCYHCASDESVRRNLCVNCRITAFTLPQDVIAANAGNPFSDAGGYRYCQGNCSTIPRPMNEFSVKDAKKCDWCLQRQAKGASTPRKTPRTPRAARTPSSERRGTRRAGSSAKKKLTLKKAASFSVKRKRGSSGDDDEPYVGRGRSSDGNASSTSTDSSSLSLSRPPRLNTRSALANHNKTDDDEGEGPSRKRLVTAASFRLPKCSTLMNVNANTDNKLPSRGIRKAAQAAQRTLGILKEEDNSDDDEEEEEVGTVYTCTPTPGTRLTSGGTVDLDLDVDGFVEDTPKRRPRSTKRRQSAKNNALAPAPTAAMPPHPINAAATARLAGGTGIAQDNRRRKAAVGAPTPVAFRHVAAGEPVESPTSGGSRSMAAQHNALLARMGIHSTLSPTHGSPASDGGDSADLLTAAVVDTMPTPSTFLSVGPASEANTSLFLPSSLSVTPILDVLDTPVHCPSDMDDKTGLGSMLLSSLMSPRYLEADGTGIPGLVTAHPADKPAACVDRPPSPSQATEHSDNKSDAGVDKVVLDVSPSAGGKELSSTFDDALDRLLGDDVNFDSSFPFIFVEGADDGDLSFS